jgi:hypothetical protein
MSGVSDQAVARQSMAALARGLGPDGSVVLVEAGEGA